MEQKINELEINGVKYVPVDSVAAKPNGNRCVIVVDRGWIFAGDVTEENGRIYLDRAVLVFGWRSVGFAAVIADPKKSKADIRAMPQRVDIPRDCEIFRIPVPENWGI